MTMDELVESYRNPWAPAFFSRLEDAIPAVSPDQFNGIYADDDEAEGDHEVGGIWTMSVRADQMWTQCLGRIRLSGSVEGDLTISIL